MAIPYKICAILGLLLLLEPVTNHSLSKRQASNVELSNPESVAIRSSGVSPEEPRQNVNLPEDVVLLKDATAESGPPEVSAEQQQRADGARPPVRRIITAPTRGGRPPVRVPNRRGLRRPRLRKTLRRRSNPRASRSSATSSKATSIPPTTTPAATVVPKIVLPAPQNESVVSNDPVVMNSSAMVANAPPAARPDEEGTDGSVTPSSTARTLILGGAISGIAIFIFLLVMLGVMFLQRTEKSRTKGSIKKIRAKEQEAKRRRIPRMKSMREVRETIFTSFRKVRKNRPPPPRT